MTVSYVLRIVLIILVLVIAIPTYRLNKEVERRKAEGDKSNQFKQKEKTLKLMVRLLVAVFLVALAAMMIIVYTPIFSK